MAGVAAVGMGLVGLSEADKAKKEAGKATALSIKQQKQVTEEEIRRQEYTHMRDISSIEAEIAASGISSVGEGLRGAEKRTETSVDSGISVLEAEVADLKSQVESYEFTFRDRGETLQKIAIELEPKLEELERLKSQQSSELSMSWNPKGGIFAEYLSERERVHFSEIAWMRKTGLSAVASISAEGQSAQARARAMQITSIGQITTGAANWWERSQPPVSTTTTQQTV